MPNFTKAIEARVADPEVPGWDVLHLKCGHLGHAPSSTKHTAEFCGVCRLNHEAHERAAVKALTTIEERIIAAGGTRNP